MDNCFFCRIIRGELPSRKIYEDDATMAFMDVAGDVDGHVLVVPKKHVKNILDCDDETLIAVARTVKKLSCHFNADCGYDGVNLLNASDESAGQSVPHFHIHIIPRKKDDGINTWPHLDGAKRDIDDVFDELKL